jgi:putative ABC transport system ATP-binding protein
MSIFQRLHQNGNTIVLVTHEPDIAEHTKRRIFFRDGKVESDQLIENQRIADPSKYQEEGA